MNLQKITKLNNQTVPNGVSGKHRHLNISGELKQQPLPNKSKPQGETAWVVKQWDNLKLASTPAAAKSLDPLSVFLAWYFISEVIRNKQLHQSGGGAPESASADPKTLLGCQVAPDSADTQSSTTPSFTLLFKWTDTGTGRNPTYLLNVSPGRQIHPTRTMWQTNRYLKRDIKEK